MTAPRTRVGRSSSSIAAVGIIWRREIIRWWRDKTRIIGSLGMPIIFLLIFGVGLSGAMGSLIGEGSGGPTIDFKQFIFPGIIAMNVFFASIFNGISLVYDREFGILKEVLVAPVNRASVAFGKTLGGATVATVQGTLVFLFAPLVGVTLTPILVLQLWPVMFLGAFGLSGMGVALAARMRSTEAFQVVNQFVTFPLIFLSGVFFPLQGLPAWMTVLVKVNPITYAVDPLRRLVLDAQGLPAAVLDRLPDFGLGIKVFGHAMTVGQDLIVVTVFGVVMNLLAMWLVSIQD
ncbi:inner membrane transport permease YbhR [bacterium BMS3Abin02]|nr:inner membrane transport permease YbhR [bacterium BMS3Abin02]GBE21942.1 inner membrane transport permease YbhR [bacterium BMS3Bbin01]HDH25348.1 ABC transporter [Actinomycetota bacterium]